MALNQYSNDDAIIQGAERVYHDVDAGGNCRVPWCTYSSDAPDREREHINIDRALTEPGRHNFKMAERLREQQRHMRAVLEDTYRDEVNENADHHLENTHHLTLRVLKMLKDKAEGRNEKLRRLGEDQDTMLAERNTLMNYIWETFNDRAQLLEASGVGNGISLAIGIMENLRDQLESMGLGPKEDDNAPTNEGPTSGDDPMRPESRRNVTLNDLRATLLGMLLSGADVPVKHLNEFIERYVVATDSIVRRSVDLESDQECCVGCTEHSSVDPKYGDVIDDVKSSRVRGRRGRRGR